MTMTTTAQNACNAQVWIDNAAGTLTNISGSASTVQLSPDHEIGEFKVFGSRWKGRLCCGQDLPINLTIVYSTTADEGWAILKAWYFTNPCTQKTVAIYMPDKNVGSDKIYGEFLLASMDWTLDSSDAGPVIVSASLLPDGEVSHTVTAT